jgi:benzoyl-CoA reductase/2-hydroxyglutaryl-CoA dehydratase subunit BcrC/BadD/HgdB
MLSNRIRQAAQGLENEDLAEFRQKGGRALGYFCSYVPEELLNVDGLASFRMRSRGCAGTEMADSYMGILNCSYTRHCLETGLEGGYDFLDGFVFVPSCDHMRRLYDNWAHFLDPPFLALLDVPHVRDEDALQWYRDEIAMLWETLADGFDLNRHKDTVRQGIRKTNRTRQLLAELDGKRLHGPGGPSGTEMLALSLFAASVPRETVNPVLEGLAKSLRDGSPQAVAPHRARVLLVGSHLDDTEFTRLLEDTGALVVRDAYCCGLRDQLDLVDESDEDPFRAIALRYLDRLSCPRMYGDYPRRLETIVRMAEEGSVDGVILEQMKFCETWGIDGNVLFQDLRERDIPVLRLEREYRISGVGQHRTRVQAFLESMGK